MSHEHAGAPRPHAEIGTYGLLPSRARCSHGRLRQSYVKCDERDHSDRISTFDRRIWPAAPCRAHALSAHGDGYACMHEGASLSAVELRRGCVVIPKHDLAAVACVSCDWRLLRIHFVIGEKSLALGAVLRTTQLFSTLSVCNILVMCASPELSQAHISSMARDGRTDEQRTGLKC